ncbi:MAG: hypothetical protein ACTSR2_00450 [Candidatus Hodarchaeales archaeon]
MKNQKKKHPKVKLTLEGKTIVRGSKVIFQITPKWDYGDQETKEK